MRLAAFFAPSCDRRRPLWLHRSRGARHDRGGAIALDRGLRPLRDRLRRGGVLPGPARPHRRGVADEVRLPLRLVGAVGAAARALPRGAPAEAARRAFAGLALLALAPFADTIFSSEGLTWAFVAAAPLPLLQSPENVSATALLLRGRYDLRGLLQTVSTGLRLIAIAIGGAARRRRGGRRNRDRTGGRHGHRRSCRPRGVPALPKRAGGAAGRGPPGDRRLRAPVERRDGIALAPRGARARSSSASRPARPRSASSGSRRRRSRASRPRARRCG